MYMCVCVQVSLFVCMLHVCVCVCVCVFVSWEEGVSVSVSMYVCKNVNVYAFIEGRTHMNKYAPSKLLPSLLHISCSYREQTSSTDSNVIHKPNMFNNMNFK